MRTTLYLDENLLKQAQAETGVRSKTEVVELGLQALIRQAARERLKHLYGKMPNLKAVARR